MWCSFLSEPAARNSRPDDYRKSCDNVISAINVGELRERKKGGEREKKRERGKRNIVYLNT